MRAITRYQAFDGTEFDTAESCRNHEAKHVENRLVGLTLDQVRAAVAREDAELAEAIEELGQRIAKARREAGDLKRRPKGSDAAPPALDPDEARGRTSFRDGIPNVIPPDLRDDPARAERYMTGWDYERLAQAGRHAA